MIQKKKLFWFWYEGNDYDDFNREFNNKILKKYFFDDSYSQGLINKKKILRKYLTQKNLEQLESLKFINYKNFFKLYYTRQLVKLIFSKNKLVKNKAFNNGNYNNDIDKIILKIINLSKEKGYKLHFFYLPSYFRLLDKNYKINKNFEKSKIKKFLFKNNIDFYDFTNDIINSDNPKKYFALSYSTHYNKFAYDQISKKIISINNNE